MILIKQAIRAQAKGKTVIVAVGKYSKVPEILAADVEFVSYVKNGLIEGVELTEEQEKHYKSVPVVAVKTGYEKITPESEAKAPKKKSTNKKETNQKVPGKNKV